MPVTINWELPDGRHMTCSGEADEVRAVMTHAIELERKLVWMEAQVAHLEEMVATVLQVQKLDQRVQRRREARHAKPMVATAPMDLRLLRLGGNGNGTNGL